MGNGSYKTTREDLEKQIIKAPGIFDSDFPHTEERLEALITELKGHPGAYDSQKDLFVIDKVSEWVITRLHEFRERYNNRDNETHKAVSGSPVVESYPRLGQPNEQTPYEELMKKNIELQQLVASLEKELNGTKDFQKRVISSLGPTVEGDFYKKIRGKIIELESRVAVSQREKTAALDLLQSERERLERNRRFLLRYLKERRGVNYDSESSFENIVLALEEAVNTDFAKAINEKENMLDRYKELEIAHAKAEEKLAENEKLMEEMREVSEWIKLKYDKIEEEFRRTEAERNALAREFESISRDIEPVGKRQSSPKDET